MPKFMFSENEEIWRKNKPNRDFRRNNYVSTVTGVKKKVAIVNDKPRLVRLNCRSCGDSLRNKASQYLGICPTCDNA